MKTILFRTLLIMGSVILSLGFTEWFLRGYRPQPTIDGLKGPYQFPCYVKGAYYFARLKPDATCMLSSTSSAFADHDVRTNDMGFRNPPILPKKPQSTRILFLGDSFTMGVGVPEKETYPRLVETMLQKTRSVEAINAGINGTGPGSYYLMMAHETKGLAPDIIVVGLFPWNDIGYDVATSEQIQETDSTGRPITIDSLTAYVDGEGVLRPKHIPRWLKIPYLRSSHVVALIAFALFPTIGESIQPAGTFDYCLFTPDCQDKDDAKNTTKRLFLDMKRIADERGQKLLFLIIPAEFQVFDNSVSKYGMHPLLPSQKWALSKEFSSFFEEHAIDYLDLFPVFLLHPNNKTYFDRDPHWNALGHAIAAEAIAQKLKPYLQ